MRLSFNAVTTALVLSGLSLGYVTNAAQRSASTAKEGQWTQLFNGKDLAGWDVYLGPKMDAKQQKIPGTATGLNKDPDRVFTVAQVDGGPVMRISGVIGGGISTVNSYENYHLRLQMKWGPAIPGIARWLTAASCITPAESTAWTAISGCARSSTRSCRG